MSHVTEFAVTGHVKTTMPVYARLGTPSVYAPVAEDLPAGSRIRVCAAVVGDAVEGNTHWYRIDENIFVWAGACTRLSPYPAFPEETRVFWKAVVFEVR
jgi:hypothetical protein